MARPRNVDPIRAVIRALGHQIGQELAAAVASSHGSAAAKRGPGRPRLTGVAAICAVPGCGRKKAAKGLCQSHYAKGMRLKLNLNSLSAASLKTLAADGRATRWQK